MSLAWAPPGHVRPPTARSYYPKLQAAVPFTPVTGPRLMTAGCLPPAERAAVTRALGRALMDMAGEGVARH